MPVPVPVPAVYDQQGKCWWLRLREKGGKAWNTLKPGVAQPALELAGDHATDAAWKAVIGGGSQPVVVGHQCTGSFVVSGWSPVPASVEAVVMISPITAMRSRMLGRPVASGGASAARVRLSSSFAAGPAQ